MERTASNTDAASSGTWPALVYRDWQLPDAVIKALVASLRKTYLNLPGVAGPERMASAFATSCHRIERPQSLRLSARPRSRMAWVTSLGDADLMRRRAKHAADERRVAGFGGRYR